MYASSLILDLPTSSGPTPSRTSATTIRPVGARFPRVWFVPEAGQELHSTEPVRIFPIGCRFLRRSFAETLAHRETAEPVTTARPLSPPVGARFPRRIRAA